MAYFYNKQHGEFALDVSNDVVLTCALGPWNFECVDAFGKCYGETVYRLNLANWADIIVLHGESLLVPDAEKGLRERIGRAAAMGLAKVTLVTAQSTVATTAKGQLVRLYKDLSVTVDFVTELDDALRITRDAGYTVDETEIKRFFSEHQPNM